MFVVPEPCAVMLENSLALMWHHLSSFLSSQGQSSYINISPQQLGVLRRDAHMMLSPSIEELLKLEDAAGRSISFVHALVRRIREQLVSH